MKPPLTTEQKTSVRIPGRAGELLQVHTRPGRRIQIPGPVCEDLYSEFLFSPEIGTGPSLEDWKMNRARTLFFERAGIPDPRFDSPADLYLYRSHLPRGKGFGSSSADILGILSFLNQLYKTQWDSPTLYRLAASIEPTDPLLHRETTVFHSTAGELLEVLPERNLVAFFF